ncbi:hypothetical protein CO540_07245 [Micromonospora sp. WMMA2032]|nr:hypothetical protein CO540_07245 [Micromonospora sp. WMMA2032]
MPGQPRPAVASYVLPAVGPSSRLDPISAGARRHGGDIRSASAAPGPTRDSRVPVPRTGRQGTSRVRPARRSRLIPFGGRLTSVSRARTWAQARRRSRTVRARRGDSTDARRRSTTSARGRSVSAIRVSRSRSRSTPSSSRTPVTDATVVVPARRNTTRTRPASAGSSAVISRRSSPIARRSRRDTCICEMPSRSPICSWVWLPWK